MSYCHWWIISCATVLTSSFVPNGVRANRGVSSGTDKRISRFGDLGVALSPHDERGPAPLTNIPTDEVSRVLQTSAIGGSVPSKYRLLRSCHMSISCNALKGGGQSAVMRGGGATLSRRAA